MGGGWLMATSRRGGWKRRRTGCQRVKKSWIETYFKYAYGNLPVKATRRAASRHSDGFGPLVGGRLDLRTKKKKKALWSCWKKSLLVGLGSRQQCNAQNHKTPARKEQLPFLATSQQPHIYL